MNISKNFLNKEELSIIDNEILQNTFPWYHFDSYLGRRIFPMVTHTLVKRCDNGEEPVPNAKYYYLFENIVKRFCKQHDVSFNRFTRAALNFSMSNSKYSFVCPHVDFTFKHKLLIIYLEDTSGDTIIFDKKYTKGKVVIDIESPRVKKLKVLKRIKPERGKVMMCDGLHFHSFGFCKHDQLRRIGVFTFT